MDFSGLTTVECKLDEGLFHIILNRPEQGNAFNFTLCEELHRIVNQISERPEVRAVLVSAHGRLFCGGGDLRSMGAEAVDLPFLLKTMTAPLHSAIVRLMQMNAPVICAVQGGGAYGGGLAFAAAADIIVAAQSAKFGAAFTGIGFSCDSGGSVALRHRLGTARAKRFLLLNETLTADEALNLGLVDKVVADHTLAAEALAIAQKLAAGPTLAYGAVKRLFLHAETRSAAAQMEEEAQVLSRLVNSADAAEGLKSFLEKRKPNFSGR